MVDQQLIRNCGHTLVHSKTLVPVKVGEFVRCFEGSVWQLLGGTAPEQEGRVGRVLCQSNLHGDRPCVFYPSVFKVRWVHQ